MKYRSIGLRELKTNLSRYMDEVQVGNALLITIHGKPIGRITPVAAKQKEDLAVQTGMALWSGKRFLPKARPVKIKGRKAVTEILLENRK